MYLLFVDESGSHGASTCFVLGSLAVHEDDAVDLQKIMDGILARRSDEFGLDLRELEFHATEIKSPRGSRKTRPASPWYGIPQNARHAVLSDAYRVLADFRHKDERFPFGLFGVVMDRRFRSILSQAERERCAYEHLLKKFNDMLTRIHLRSGLRHSGLVIHDRRVVAERDIQGWTKSWREAAGTLGRLDNMVDVPMFADSRASRLIQAADLVAYALWRSYESSVRDGSRIEHLWPRFDAADGHLHGAIHLTPDYGAGVCFCPPCNARRRGQVPLPRAEEPEQPPLPRQE